VHAAGEVTLHGKKQREDQCKEGKKEMYRRRQDVPVREEKSKSEFCEGCA